jgi:endonuclease YncB( thermonuclease family)
MKFLKLLTIFSLFINIAHADTVKYVYDGDTFTTTENKKVRLLNINTPETAKKNSPSEPFAVDAKKYLTKLVARQDVILKFDKEKQDKYGRYLAYVYLKDGTFVNEKMIESGLAHLYTFPNNVEKFEELKKAENKARLAKRGIWSNPRWATQDANSEKPVEQFRFGKYQTFEGQVLKVADVRKKIFLNFGHNWRQDFSVEINKKNLKYFKAQNINPMTYYSGKKLRIRGVLRPVNGALINVSHPQQIEILK